MTRAKICGLTTPDAVAAAVDGGAAYLGFVFFPKSPRHLEPARAAALAAPARGRAEIVAVTVDADDADLEELARTLRPDLIQLHGRETPARSAEIRQATGVRVVKAISVAGPQDLSLAADYEGAVDHLMFDAKAPAGADLPGGNGAAFDWSALAGRSFGAPWFLAGGLGANNVATAVRTSGAPIVDVSSGVEHAPGYKDPRLISAFLEALRRA
jgi:phosphoribosylanthranilate isomerase